MGVALGIELVVQVCGGAVAPLAITHSILIGLGYVLREVRPVAVKSTAVRASKIHVESLIEDDGEGLEGGRVEQVDLVDAAVEQCMTR
jgi:hypothetical protein